MKRLAAWITIFVFALGTFTSAPVFFANENVAAASYVQKDTSWFDYKNPKKTYKITTEAQLIGLASLVNEEQVDRWKPTRIENFEGVTFILTKDIKLTQPWEPIGAGGASYFAGTLDGNNHTISNLQIEDTSGNCGLFGTLTGDVKNLTVKGAVSSEHSNCGGIAGTLNSTGSIVNCISNVDISGRDKVGGIVGNNDGGHVEGCINIGNISGAYKVGGVVGENWGGVISRCGNQGKIQSSKRGVATYGTGGVVGRSVSAEAEVAECYNMGEILSYTEATGGVVGYINAMGSTVKDCYNTAAIVIDQKNSNKTLSKSYAGGVVGIAGTNGVSVRNCYNTGTIEAADVFGGLIGHYINETDGQPEKYLTNNYYLTESFDSGIGEIDDPADPYREDAATGASEAALKGMAPSLSVAYTKDTGIYGNNGYPVLKWQQPISENEKIYLVGIDPLVQKKLDRYLVRTAAVVPPGQMLLNFFLPNNLTGDAFVLYMDAKEKMQEKAEEQNNE